MGARSLALAHGQRHVRMRTIRLDEINTRCCALRHPELEQSDREAMATRRDLILQPPAEGQSDNIFRRKYLYPVARQRGVWLDRNSAAKLLTQAGNEGLEGPCDVTRESKQGGYPP